MKAISDEQRRIINLISTYGCIGIEQVYALFKNIDKKKLNMLINMLIKADRIEIYMEKYLVAKDAAALYNKETINALWCMLDICKNNVESCFESMRAVPPALIFFTVNNNDSFELIPINRTKLIAVRTAQESYLKRDEKTKIIANNRYIFMTDDKSVVKAIKDCELDLPFIVAFINSYDKKGVPQFKYYKG